MQRNLRPLQNLSSHFGKQFSKEIRNLCLCQSLNVDNNNNNNLRQTHLSSKRYIVVQPVRSLQTQSKYLLSSRQPDSETSEPEKESKKPKKAGQLAKVFAEYGTTAVIFHTTISLTSLGICYTAVSRYDNLCLLGFYYFSGSLRYAQKVSKFIFSAPQTPFRCISF